MNRRRVLGALAGTAGGVLLARPAGGKEPDKPAVPGALAMKLGEETKIGARSTPVSVDNKDLHLVSVNSATFRLDKESRMTATLKVAVTQYATVEYWISIAVFDAQGRLLGTAVYKEAVQYTRIPAVPTMSQKVDLDFGISKAFGRAALVVVAISDRDVPDPG